MFSSENPEENLPLDHLTGLRSLQLFRLSIRDPTSLGDYLGPSWVNQQLQSVLGATHLQHIRLEIVVQEDPIVGRDAWVAVDSIFDGDVFPKLMRVEINPHTNMFGNARHLQPWSVIRDNVKSFFPCLQERKILDVCWGE